MTTWQAIGIIILVLITWNKLDNIEKKLNMLFSLLERIHRTNR